jgi:hypothetical protein
MDKIRLACRFCDRNDFDGIGTLPTDWFDIDEVQTYQESIREANLSDRKVSVLDWYTHLGVCPECQQAELWPTELSA